MKADNSMNGNKEDKACAAPIGRFARMLCSCPVILLVAASANGAGPLPLPDWPVELTGATAGQASGEFVADNPATQDVSARAITTITGDNGAQPGQEVPTVELPAAEGLVDPVDLQPAVSAASAVLTGHLEPEVRKGEELAHPDPVVTRRMEVLAGSGLLARQAAISESIIILERQLQQAELLRKLLTLQGPDTPIELTPGEFVVLSGTPAGRRLASEIEESELKAEIRILELRLKKESLEAALAAPAQHLPAASATNVPARNGPPVERPVLVLSLLEILGRNGNFSAILDAGGRGIMVEKGDELPDGSVVLSVGEDDVKIIRDGSVMQLGFDG